MPKPNKKQGALLKFAGAAIVLVSFLSQNFLYETWNDRVALIQRMAQTMQVFESQAALHELAYLALAMKGANMSAAEVEIAKNKLLKAIVASSVVENWNFRSAPNMRSELANVLAQLGKGEPGRIIDYPRYIAMQSESVALRMKNSDALQQETTEIYRYRNIAKWIYLMLYLAGTSLALYGLYFEWKGAEE
jgi:hypothetical protein